MSIIYIILPMAAWLVSGCLKFAINWFKNGKDALQQVGNGGFPSTHTSVVSSVVFFIGFTDGLTNVLTLAIAMLMITIIDATGVRRAVGRHAEAINAVHADNPSHRPLRIKQGHSRIEVAGGLAVGLALGYLASILI